MYYIDTYILYISRIDISPGLFTKIFHNSFKAQVLTQDKNLKAPE